MNGMRKDERVSLASKKTNRYLYLKNDHSRELEQFEILEEKGRGGSCIVYLAFKCMNGERQRPVFLKEFYPECLSGYFERDESTNALFFSPEPGEKDSVENLSEVYDDQKSR